jgi:polyhydroxyalkanoate synthase
MKRDEGFDAPALMALEADRMAHAYAARATAGLSPAALALAFGDWGMHLAAAPGKQNELARKAARKWIRYLAWLGRAAQGGACPGCIEPLPQDSRFAGPHWQAWPFNALQQGFLLMQQWWWNATTGVRGVTPHHEDVVTFTVRQMLDVWSPSNFPWLNPEVLRAAWSQGGLNFAAGAENFLEDWRREVLGQPPVGADAFQPGRDVAVTPGRVVMRNRVAELIQYAPSTPQVHPEPILVVPAWIMKYYILDLSPHNSLVKFLVSRGHTVFILSWKNPGPEDGDLSMDHYRRLGVMAALETIGRLVPGRKVHAAGYCLGGTLLAIAAATMARERDERLASVTLLAAQVDFEEAGELTLFIDDSQVSLLEDMMMAQGFLDTRQMAGAFQLLRSNDLIWSRRVKEYLLGERPAMNDLMAWNADATRMPYAMHSEYLRRLFLRNDLAEGRYDVDGRKVALADLRAPMFVAGTENDHVAPWRSVYKAGLFTDADLTFLLASGGHNAGIVSEPGHPHRGYRVAARAHGEPYVDAETWLARTPRREGSWWPEWQSWLAAHSGAPAAPPAMGEALGEAPGEYVMQR